MRARRRVGRSVLYRVCLRCREEVGSAVDEYGKHPGCGGLIVKQPRLKVGDPA